MNPTLSLLLSGTLTPLSLSSSSCLSSHPHTLITPPCSSSTFVLLQNKPNNQPRVVFLVSAPHSSGSCVLLRFFVLLKSKFVKANVVFTQKDLSFDEKVGVLVDGHHGVSVRLSGSVNFFAMHSVSMSKISVFAVKLMGDDGDGNTVKLMRCAVIECCKPVWSICISFGFLVFGEENGVRILNLRGLVKGKGKGKKTKSVHIKVEGQELRLSTQDVREVNDSEAACGGCLKGEIDKGNTSGECLSFLLVVRL